MIGVHPQSDVYKKSAEIGYWIGEPHWGKGIATEATKQLVSYAFEQLDLVRLYAGVFSFNPASGRVMQKLGMIQEGLLRDHTYRWGKHEDLIAYGLLSSDTCNS